MTLAWMIIKALMNHTECLPAHQIQEKRSSALTSVLGTLWVGQKRSCQLSDATVSHTWKMTSGWRSTTDWTHLTCIQILSQMQVTAMKPAFFSDYEASNSSTSLRNPQKYTSRLCSSTQEKSRKIGLTSMSVMCLMLARLWSYEA